MYKRSDVYYRMVQLDQRLHVGAWLDRRRGNPEAERVVQDVEIPVDRLGDFLDWFDAEVGMRPVWLCPLFAGRKWPTYPLQPDQTYVNVGFWGNVGVGPEAPEAPRNRAIEAKVHELDGHKSLYSEAFYDRETFDALYDGANLRRVKDQYDPQHRLTDLYDKAVRRR
jgi:FAD/FMN-containing dehydrogenase